MLNLATSPNSLEQSHLIIPSQIINHNDVCWFKNQAFSEGSVLEMADNFIKVCAYDQYKPRGKKLTWLNINQQGAIEYSKKTRKITVN